MSGGADRIGGGGTRALPGRGWADAALVLAVLAYALLFLGARAIWEPDEGRYTAVALQMLRSGDWFHPRLHHELLHYDKPPLSYWLIAGSLRLFGRDPWAVRLPIALAFAATVLLVRRLGSTFVPRSPWLPALLYALSPLPYGAAQIVGADTVLTLFETLAVTGFVDWRWSGRGGGRLVMWAGFGLAFLTKGPPALLPLLAICTLAAANGGWSRWKPLFAVSGPAVFAVIALPWYLILAVQTPGLLATWVGDEVLGRMFSGRHHRNAQWYGAFAVYVPTLFVGFLPWIFCVARRPRTLVRDLVASCTRDVRRTRPRGFFVVLWFAVPLAVFCVARSRLPLYVLPLFVPLSLATAMRAAGRHRPAWAWAAAAGTAVLLAGIRLGASRYERPTRDARELAARITMLAPFRPSEVVFVDRRPFFGLTLYLATEVEPVGFVAGEPGCSSDLRTELGEDEDRRLFVVAPDKKGAFEACVRSYGWRPRYLGDYPEVELFAVDKE